MLLRDEHRLRVFQNRVLRRIFGPKRDGITAEWRKLHNEELKLLKTKRNLLYIRNQFVPRSKHFSPRL